MPKTLWGKISLGVLVLLVLQTIYSFVKLFEHPLAGLTQVLIFTPYTAPLGVIFGLIGLIKEKARGKIVPVVTLIITVVYLILYFMLIQYGYHFGE